MNRRFAVLLPTIALATAVACGSSSNGNGNPGTQNEGDAGSSSGSTGSTGSSGSGGSTTTGAGDTGAPSSAPVVCGGTTCSAPSGAIIPLAACCQADNTCGATFSAGGLGGLGGAAGGAALPDGGLPCLDTSAGTTDSTCPSQMLMGISLPGCCTKTSVCGTNLSMIGLGCNSLGALLGGLGGAPQACGAGADGSAPVSDAAPASDATPE